MAVVASILFFALLVLLLLLIFRLVIEYVFMFARSYRPAGPVAIALELCYSVTDPPLRFLGRLIPPLRIGNVLVPLDFLVLFILVQVLMFQVLQPLTR